MLYQRKFMILLCTSLFFVTTMGGALGISGGSVAYAQTGARLNSAQNAVDGDVRGYWQFQDNLLDSSSYGNDGISNPVNPPDYRPGIGLKNVDGNDGGIGVSGLFRNGSELPISLANQANSLVITGTQITLEAWVKSSDFGIGGHHIIDNLNGYALSIIDKRPAVMFRGGSSWWGPDDIPELSPYQWYYIAATYDGNVEKLYVNGKLSAQRNASGSIFSGTTPARVAIGGMGSGDPAYLFDGTIDEVRVTARALNDTEIQANYDLRMSTIPIIFVPGFGGTELYDTTNGNNQLIWLNIPKLANPLTPDDLFLDPLRIDNDNIRPEKVMTTVLENIKPEQTDIYKTFVDYLTLPKPTQEPIAPGIYDLKDYHGNSVNPYVLGTVGNLDNDSNTYYDHVVNYAAGQNLWLFPVDFRKGVYGSLSPSDNVERLNTLVNDVLEKTGATQVNFVAHSQGGMVIREFIRDTDRAHKINRLITLGTPYLGLPWAFQGLRYGSDFDISILGSKIINPVEVKKLVQNFPGAYELLPSPSYFQFYPAGYFYTDRDLDGNGQADGAFSSYDDMYNFLLRDQVFDFGQTTTHYNQDLVRVSRVFQEGGIAGWSISAAREVGRDIIVGSGSCTVGVLEELENKSGPSTFVIPTNGDGTVPFKSADLGKGMSNSVVDTAQIYYVVGVTHQYLPNKFVQDVAKLLNEEKINKTTHLLLSPPIMTPCKGLSITNADLSITELSTGNTTGTIEDSSDYKVEIPGSNFFRFVKNQVALLPNNGATYSVSIRGTQTGTFDLRFQDWQDSQVTKTILFKDVPQNPATKASVNYENGSPVLIVDKYGDGTDVVQIPPTSEVTEGGNDFIPPVTTIQIDGTLENNAYVSSATITLSATDDQSGVLNTVYSLDGGQTLIPYNGSFVISKVGSWVIQAGSTDKVGNSEWPYKSITLTITPDTKIDTQPANPSTSADAIFTFSSTDSAASLECSLDSGPFSVCTSPKSYTGLADGSRTFAVRANDSAGYLDATPASYTWMIDTTSPDTQIDTKPANLTASTEASFAFSSTDGTATFECSLDNGVFAACTSLKTYSSLPNGSHTFAVRAKDPAGNPDNTPSSYTWIIDNIAPDTQLDSHPTNLTIATDASFNFSSADDTATFECSLDGGTFSACISPKSYIALANGSHTFAVRAKDPAGNVDASPASFTWVIYFQNSRIGAGDFHTCALTYEGGVQCWGYNTSGQLGDGTTTQRIAPVNVSGLSSGVTAIAAGYSYTCALTSAGGVKCWGGGLMGDGTNAQHLVPVDVSGLNSGVISITAGYSHTCALLNTGGVKCWGNNSYGQLGDGTTTHRLAPVGVSGLSSGVIAITAGYSHTCALLTTGGVKCWGRNYYGEVGDGTTIQRLAPVDVSGLSTGVKAIMASRSGSYTCAVTSAGGVKCWGDNSYYQLGDGTATKRLVPVDVSGLSSGVTGITASGFHTCALTSVGGVKCWGYNFYGEVGNGILWPGSERISPRVTAPVDVIGLGSGVVAITAGNIHTCALMSTGMVKCWGDNSNGQIGDGAIYPRTAPVNASTLGSGMAKIAGNTYHACALTNAGEAKCWGWNTDGQIGDGDLTTSQHLVPVLVSDLSSGVTAITTGYKHTCALTSTGGVKCWGYNLYGEVGDGTTTQRSSPVNVSGLTNGVTAIAAGFYHTCALTSAGGVKCWGENVSGELGNGTTAYSLVPVNVSGLSSGVKAIVAGSVHTCALLNSGGVKCWGDNTNGQLGDGSTINRSAPVAVSNLSGVKAIAAGAYHTCALLNSGGLKCWGENVGQLGDGTTTQRLVPVNVSGLTSGVTAVAAGAAYTCALTSVGGVKCWGYNSYGQVGDGTTTQRLVPVNVNNLTSGVTSIMASTYHMCALTNAGVVKCWGRNTYGLLGNREAGKYSVPKDTLFPYSQ